MKALFIQQGPKVRIVNLDNVSAIVFDQSGLANPCLAFWIAGDPTPVNFWLPKYATEAGVMHAVDMALRPLYDGRMNNVLGIKLQLLLDEPPENDRF